MRRRTLLLIIAISAGVLSLLPGCDELVTDTTQEVVAGVPTADFAATVDSGCVPLTVNFLDQSSGPRHLWRWYFGDGDSSHDTNPVHIYDSIGSYTCSLSIEDTFTGKIATEIKKRFIIVGQSIGGFTMSQNSGCPPLEVTFTPQNYHGITSWSWNYGDGSVKGTDSIVTHIYSKSGIRVVTLTVNSSCGQTKLTDTVTVADCPAVWFVVDSTSGCAPLTLAFGDSSDVGDSNVLVSRMWDFGNGITSTAQNPTVLFDTSGVYTVSLAVTSSGGADTLTRDSFITVWDPAAASFSSLYGHTGCDLDTSQFIVWFDNNSVGDIDSFRWYFGDGTTDTITNPAHAYLTPGGYTVTLMAYGPCGGDTTTVLDYVVLYDSLVSASFSYTVDTGNGLAYTFLDESPGMVAHRTWKVDTTGLASGLQQVQYVFPSAGTYLVTLTTSNDCNEAVAESSLVVVQ